MLFFMGVSLLLCVGDDESPKWRSFCLALTPHHDPASLTVVREPVL
jgi:hypothetical protein